MKRDLIDEHTEICIKLTEIFENKNHDYGNSFGETFKKLGLISAVTRISDKFNRLIALSTLKKDEQKVKNETLEDTLLDMANYCIMTIMELKNNESEN